MKKCRIYFPDGTPPLGKIWPIWQNHCNIWTNYVFFLIVFDLCGHNKVWKGVIFVILSSLLLFRLGNKNLIITKLFVEQPPVFPKVWVEKNWQTIHFWLISISPPLPLSTSTTLIIFKLGNFFNHLCWPPFALIHFYQY